MAWLELLMRVVVSCDKPGRGAYILRTQDHLMGLPILNECSVRSGNPLN
jgi:hypothetical protein